MDFAFGTEEVPPPLYRATLIYYVCIEKVMYDIIELLSYQYYRAMIHAHARGDKAKNVIHFAFSNEGGVVGAATQSANRRKRSISRLPSAVRAVYHII